MSVVSVVVRTVWIPALCAALALVGRRRRPPLLVTLYALVVAAASLFMVLTDLAWKPEDGASFAGMYLMLVSAPTGLLTGMLPASFFDNAPIARAEGVLILAGFVQVALLWGAMAAVTRRRPRRRTVPRPAR